LYQERIANLHKLGIENQIAYEAMKTALPILQQFGREDAVPLERKSKFSRRIYVVSAWAITARIPDNDVVGFAASKSFPIHDPRPSSFLLSEEGAAGWCPSDDSVYIDHRNDLVRKITPRDAQLGAVRHETGKNGEIWNGSVAARSVLSLVKKYKTD
jgi:hypothetical protein